MSDADQLPESASPLAAELRGAPCLEPLLARPDEDCE